MRRPRATLRPSDLPLWQVGLPLWQVGLPLRLAGVAVWLGLGGLLAGAVDYQGVWAVEAGPGLVVDRPESPHPGATLRVRPAGTGPVTSQVRAVLEWPDQTFDGVQLLVATGFDPKRVHARLRIDGELAALLEPTTNRAIDLNQAGHRLELEVVVQEAAPKGWEVQISRLVLRKTGFRVLYSHDAAGLIGWVEGPGRVRLGVDPDWAELGWPLAGSLTLQREPPGGVQGLGFRVMSALPHAGLQARASVDGLPLELFDGPAVVAQPRTYAVAGQNAEVSLRATVASPGQKSWTITFDDLDFGMPVAEPGSATASEPSAPGSGMAGGCTAGTPGQPAGVALLAVLAIAAWILRRRVEEAPCCMD